MKRYLLFLLSVAACIGLASVDTAHASFGTDIAGHGHSWTTIAALFGLGASVVGLVSTDLGAALRGGGCKAAPGPRNWVRVDAPDGTRAYPGAMVQTRWTPLKAKDPMGRFGYIRSLAIRGTATVVAADNTTPAISAYQMKSIINQIDLMDVSGHKYFAALDARDIIDDCYYRHGRLPFALAGSLAVNIGAGSYDRSIDLEIPLVSRAVGASSVEGLIPVAAMQLAPAEAFQFFLRSTIPVAGGTAADLSISGFKRPDGTAGLEIWAEVVYIAPNEGDLPPVIDAPWMLRNYVLQGLDQVLESESRKHIYAHIRYRPEDVFNAPGGVNGQQLAAGIDGYTVEVGGDTYLSALRTIDITTRGTELKYEGVTGFGDSAEALGIAALVLPAENGVTTPDVYTMPFRPAEDAPAGPVVVHMATQPCTSTRWLHRSVGCDSASRARSLKQAMGCACDVRVQANSKQGVDATLPKMLVK